MQPTNNKTLPTNEINTPATDVADVADIADVADVANNVQNNSANDIYKVDSNDKANTNNIYISNYNSLLAGSKFNYII
jgi:hypothetical protein